jgi:DNA-binding transcriptional MerR regulator
MEYTINKLAKMAGISTRTLRYYDYCGLLRARRNGSNGYRVYGQADVDRLQQILFYRTLDVGLDEIARILAAPDFNAPMALDGHLAALKAKREQLDTLIGNVENSIRAMKGEIMMNDQEKFEGFKQKRIDDNEQRYGAEIRARYGDAIIDQANANLKGMSQERYTESERITESLNETLKAAYQQGDPAGALAQNACALHREWLMFWWGDSVPYSKEAHRAMGQMYVEDARFTAYYDRIAPGLAVFLRDALQVYCR